MFSSEKWPKKIVNTPNMFVFKHSVFEHTRRRLHGHYMGTKPTTVTQPEWWHVAAKTFCRPRNRLDTRSWWPVNIVHENSIIHENLVARHKPLGNCSVYTKLKSYIENSRVCTRPRLSQQR